MLLGGNWEIILTTNYDCGAKEMVQLLRACGDLSEDQNQFSILIHWEDSKVPANPNPGILISSGLHRYFHTLVYTLTVNHTLIKIKYF